MDVPFLESRKMNAVIRFRGATTILMSMVLLSFPLSLGAQSAQERAREREIRQHLERLEVRLREVREEELARMESRLKAVREHELARIEEALVRVRERSTEAEAQLRKLKESEFAEQLAALEQAQQHYQQAAEVNRQRRGEREARVRALQHELQEARVRVREADREGRNRAEDAYRRALQEARRVQEVVVRVRSRIRLGVSLNGNQGEEFDSQGVRLEGVIDDSPAQEAGLQEGDIITHLNGQSLVQPIPEEAEEEFDEDESLPVQRLMTLAAELEAGDEVEVRFLRDGEASTVTFEAANVREPVFSVIRPEVAELESLRGVLKVEPEGRVWHFELPEGKDRSIAITVPELEKLHLEKLEELEGLERLKIRMPEMEFATPERGVYTVRRGSEPFSIYMAGRAAYQGLELTELNEGLAQYFSTDSGVLVLDAEEESSLGLIPGDVILSIDGRQVEEPGDVRRILASYEEDETVALTIMRRGQQATVEGTIR
jgi:C-terminal processing protease CtpA/Prc